ncbi:unnamed protein product [Pleuronectes platessa]|uniref:Uncharacterized protein n=1 Tax=Pleuronectes platessa TaxID=8262 RepID=A0A9N7TRD2_PLEPL|nr:unnamed protein product [Pleuronectes platessa]
MGHQAHMDNQERKDILDSKDQLDHLVKEDSLAQQGYLVKESQVKMALPDSQVCQVPKDIQDHQVCQGSQDCLGLVNQVSQDQRVIKVPLGLKETVGKEGLKGLMEARVNLVLLGYLVRVVCQETMENQGQEDPQGQVVSKEMMDTKALKESQEWMVQQDQLGLLVFLGQKEMVVSLVYREL